MAPHSEELLSPTSPWRILWPRALAWTVALALFVALGLAAQWREVQSEDLEHARWVERQTLLVGSTLIWLMGVAALLVWVRRIARLRRDRAQAITALARGRDALQVLSQATASYGKDFFQGLALASARALGADVVIVGELESPQRVRTLAFCRHGCLGEDFTYNLEGTPCAGVVGQCACLIQDQLQARFPQDLILQEWGIQAYLGIPVVDGQDRTLGILVALFEKPVEDEGFAHSILGILSQRTASEIVRLRTEQALKESEARFHSIFDSMNEMAVLHEVLLDTEKRPLDYRILDCNPAFTAITGIPREQACGALASALYGTGRAPYLELFAQVALERRPLQFETHFAPMGKTFGISVSSPAPGQFTTISSDISARKRVEEALAIKERAVDSAITAMAMTDMEGRITYVNAAFVALWALGDGQKALGANLQDFWENLASSPLSHGVKALREGRWSGELMARRPDGSAFPAQAAINLVEDHHGRPLCVLGSFLDLTERKRAEDEHKRLEAEILHAQKLESLGSLAGGIAHDMNNVLAAILGLGSALQERYSADPILGRAMDTILHAAGRGRDLVKGLTDFARKGLQEAQPLDLNELVRKEEALLGRTTLQRVRLELDLEAHLPPILGEPTALGNALMNLCVNAVDAMPEGGLLSISTSSQGKNRVEVRVKDVGEGMSPEVLARAIEPFYTTKPLGKGTGLGLAIAYGTVKAHGGTMDIQSEPGKGTEITLRFPALPDPTPGSPKELKATSTPPRSLRVLLVDDDDLIRDTVPAMLEPLGHSCQVASSGPEAVELLAEGLEVDVLILDQNMPGQTGSATLPRIRELRPQVPVLIATGHKDDQVERALATHSGLSILLKPYTLAELREALSTLGSMAAIG